MRNVEKFPQCKIAGLQKEIYERSNNRKERRWRRERKGANKIARARGPWCSILLPLGSNVSRLMMSLWHTQTQKQTYTHTDSHHFQSSIVDPRCQIPIGFTVNYAQRWNANNRNVCSACGPSATLAQHFFFQIFPFLCHSFFFVSVFFVTNLMIFASKLKRFFIDPPRFRLRFRVRLGVSLAMVLVLLCQLELVNPFTRTDCRIRPRPLAWFCGSMSH